MGRNPMTYSGFPPAHYDPPTCDAVSAPISRAQSRWLLSIVCTIIALIVFGGLWLIGIPTKSDLK